MLGITSGVNIGVRIYGFSAHLDIYCEILRLAKIENESRRNMEIAGLYTNKLRDIKSKIKSDGKCGRKDEMVQGIQKKMRDLRRNYIKNNKKRRRNDEYEASNHNRI